MQRTPGRTNVKAIEAALATARATVAALEALLIAPDARETDLLDAKATMATYGVARDGLLAAASRGELDLHRGPRNRILVDRSELERWLRSRPHRPSARPRSEPPSDLAAWDAEQERELQALRGST